MPQFASLDFRSKARLSPDGGARTARMEDLPTLSPYRNARPDDEIKEIKLHFMHIMYVRSFVR